MGRDADRHEREVCGAFAEWIARRHGLGATVDEERKPDAEDRTCKQPDSAFTVDDTPYVVEHTRLTTYPEQLCEDTGFKEVVWPLDGNPVGPFTLVARGEAADYQRVRRPAQALACRSAIFDWVRSLAPTLRSGEIREAAPPQLPFPITLWRHEHRTRRTLEVARFSKSPELRELLRRAVIRDRLEKKLPKLRRAAAHERACSALLLESNDPAQAGSDLISAAVAGEIEVTEAASGWVPDLVYLVEPYFDPWWLTAIRHGRTPCAGPRFSGRITEDAGWPPLPVVRTPTQAKK